MSDKKSLRNVLAAMAADNPVRVTAYDYVSHVVARRLGREQHELEDQSKVRPNVTVQFDINV